MPLVSILTGGSLANPITSRKTYNIDDAKADELVTAFIHERIELMPEGLTIRQQAEWKLRQAHQKMVNFFMVEVKRNGRMMAQAEIDAVNQQIEQRYAMPTPTEE